MPGIPSLTMHVFKAVMVSILCNIFHSYHADVQALRLRAFSKRVAAVRFINSINSTPSVNAAHNAKDDLKKLATVDNGSNSNVWGEAADALNNSPCVIDNRGKGVDVDNLLRVYGDPRVDHNFDLLRPLQAQKPRGNTLSDYATATTFYSVSVLKEDEWFKGAIATSFGNKVFVTFHNSIFSNWAELCGRGGDSPQLRINVGRNSFYFSNAESVLFAVKEKLARGSAINLHYALSRHSMLDAKSSKDRVNLSPSGERSLAKPVWIKTEFVVIMGTAVVAIKFGRNRKLAQMMFQLRQWNAKVLEGAPSDSSWGVGASSAEILDILQSNQANHEQFDRYMIYSTDLTEVKMVDRVQSRRLGSRQLLQEHGNDVTVKRKNMNGLGKVVMLAAEVVEELDWTSQRWAKVDIRYVLEVIFVKIIQKSRQGGAQKPLDDRLFQRLSNMAAMVHLLFDAVNDHKDLPVVQWVTEQFNGTLAKHNDQDVNQLLHAWAQFYDQPWELPKWMNKKRAYVPNYFSAFPESQRPKYYQMLRGQLKSTCGKDPAALCKGIEDILEILQAIDKYMLSLDQRKAAANPSGFDAQLMGFMTEAKKQGDRFMEEAQSIKSIVDISGNLLHELQEAESLMSARRGKQGKGFLKKMNNLATEARNKASAWFAKASHDNDAVGRNLIVLGLRQIVRRADEGKGLPWTQQVKDTASECERALCKAIWVHDDGDLNNLLQNLETQLQHQQADDGKTARKKTWLQEGLKTANDALASLGGNLQMS